MKGVDDGEDGLNDEAFDRALGLRKRRRAPARRKVDPSEPPAWPRIGDFADYSPVIGEPPAQFGLKVSTEPDIVCGTWVVWLEGKSGCVAIAALSKHEPKQDGAR